MKCSCYKDIIKILENKLKEKENEEVLSYDDEYYLDKAHLNGEIYAIGEVIGTIKELEKELIKINKFFDSKTDDEFVEMIERNRKGEI